MKWWSILLIPGLYLSNSRGAWALVAFGIIAYFIRKPFILLTATLVAASWVASSLYVNEIQRLEIWRYAINLMVWTGHGVGSFAELWYHDNARLWKPEYVHNDYLQLIFEYGIGVVPLFAVGFWLAMQKSSAMWPLYITCCICACFAFPFYTPITAFIWALACGGIIRKSHGTP
jgi:O-antigen ligase